MQQVEGIKFRSSYTTPSQTTTNT